MGAVAAFVLGPVGRWLLIAAAFLAWTALQRHEATVKAKAVCNAEQLQEDLTEMQRQRDAAWSVVADAEKRQAASDAALAKLQREGDAINEESKPLATSSCAIPPAATKRMRNIR